MSGRARKEMHIASKKLLPVLPLVTWYKCVSLFYTDREANPTLLSTDVQFSVSSYR